MNEQEVRALVREAIERHLGRPDEGVRGKGRGALAPYPSHVLLNVLPGSEVDEGMCVIEPAARCSHCGFCQSYGH
jgi:hypothetical protein